MQKILIAKDVKELQKLVDKVAIEEKLYIVNSVSAKKSLVSLYNVTVSNNINGVEIVPKNSPIQKILTASSLEELHKMVMAEGENGLGVVADITSRGALNSEFIAVVSNIPLLASGVDDSGTKVTVGGLKQDVWNADTKIDKDGFVYTDNNFSDLLLAKLNSIEEGAQKYTHPLTHPADMIDETVEKSFVSNVEKTTWNEKVDDVKAPLVEAMYVRKNGGWVPLELKEGRILVGGEKITVTDNLDNTTTIDCEIADEQILADGEREKWDSKTDGIVDYEEGEPYVLINGKWEKMPEKTPKRIVVDYTGDL